MDPQVDLDRIADSDHLLDMLIQMENVLDSLDVYCYRNWFSGEVVEGPIVRRYWATMSLLYPRDKMPDPRAALRLLKHGVQVEFDRMQRKDAKIDESEGEAPPAEEWLVRLSFPRRLLDQSEENDLQLYADEINPDDVEDAKDTGIDSESSLHADEQLPNGDGPPPDEDDDPTGGGTPPAPPAPR